MIIFFREFRQRKENVGYMKGFLIWKQKEFFFFFWSFGERKRVKYSECEREKKIEFGGETVGLVTSSGWLRLVHIGVSGTRQKLYVV